MFIEQGIKAVRMDDIAQNLAVSKRTLYEMFKDKRELLSYCMEYYTAEADSYMANQTKDAKDVIDEITRILRAYYTKSEHDRVFMHSFAKFYPDLFEPFRKKHYDDGEKRLKKILEDGVRQGLFSPDINIEVSVLMFSIIMSGIASSNAAQLPKGLRKEYVFTYIVANFFRGLSTEKGLALMDKYREQNKEIYVR